MSNPVRIVIVEDDQQIAEIQQRFLQRIEDCELVGIAHSLREAEDLVEVLKPDLLLLDVQLPDGLGFDLLRSLRAQYINTDVILVTAAREVTALREAMHGGVFDFILKPLVFERLQESIKNYQNHLAQLHGMEVLAQKDLDSLLQRKSTPVVQDASPRLPKGIDPLTLEKILQVFAAERIGLNAESVGGQIGASRTTARRYLEYLISTGELEADIHYGTVGRPERQYLRNKTQKH
ncbi:two-component system response regulator [Endozoicomonas sp. (ex Bugula neritina AB1)]|nr:two-component system response regulator [Endozoicomonas sp. (ex Bugula neritina AB1)]